MPNLTDIRDRLSGVLRRTRHGFDTEARLAGTNTTDAVPVGGIWRGQMVSGPLRMQVLATLRNLPRPGTPTWYATGVSQESWETAKYDTNLGPVVITSHSFNPQGHYYEVEGFGEVSRLSDGEIH